MNKLKKDIDNEYLVWDIESYYKEDINNYRSYIVAALGKKPDALKNAKETLKHRLRLSGGNQDPPLSFITDVESYFFFVLFSDRVLIYKNDEVRLEKEKVSSYITLNLVNQNALQEFYFLTVKNTKYLLIMTEVFGFFVFFFYYYLLKDRKHKRR